VTVAHRQAVSHAKRDHARVAITRPARSSAAQDAAAAISLASPTWRLSYEVSISVLGIVIGCVRVLALEL
jgi:DNA polymerase IIIc chi subunit